MSEQNILNPDVASEMSPDYGYDNADASQIAGFQPRGGVAVSRLIAGNGRTFNLNWNKRLSATARTLEQWERQYRFGFFSYYHIPWNRYFSGRFTGPLSLSEAGNDQWNIKGQFQEMPGLPLYTYPNVFFIPGGDSLFIEETDDFGNPTPKLTGTWTLETAAQHHGGKAYKSSTTNDTAEWLYFGYGFRLWSAKGPTYGRVEMTIDGGAPSTIDLAAVGLTTSAAVTTVTSLRLDWHRIKLRCTGTGFGAPFTVFADAIEVIQ